MKNESEKKTYHQLISCVAGRSGGHIVPCITLAMQHNKNLHEPFTKQIEILFFSSDQPLDTTILKNYKQVAQHIPLTMMNVPYKKFWRLPLFAVQLIRTFLQSFYFLLKYKPCRIISTGGYISIPVCLAGWILRIPIDLYELNVAPGKATKFLAYIATNILICFKETQSYFKQPTQLHEYPIRFSPTELQEPSDPQTLVPDYKPNKKTILVLGGSQGSDFLNHQICQLATLYGPELQIIHQTGHAHITLLKTFYTNMKLNATVFAYQENLTPYYQIANLVICRAGAGTLFETLFFKKPCITIPLEIASTDHQLDNALALQNQYPNLVTVLRQHELLADQSLLFNTVLRSVK